MSDLRIQGGRVLDPAMGHDGLLDVLIRDGKILSVGSPAEIEAQVAPDAEVVDATDKVVVPGLIDIHVHFREPGMEEQETIASGAAAAVAGGFTSVACMPNTDPAMDTEADMQFVYARAQKAGLANVFPMGAITAGRAGKELAEMGQMARGGAVAFTDDGTAVPSADLLRRAMLYAKMLDKPIVEHCEDASLAGQGVMNEGYFSTILGLQGVPAEAEEVCIARDIALARLTGARLHIQHISTRRSVEMVRQAKAEGLLVTAEVTPHHLTLTDECVTSYDPVFKVNPPLRSDDDVQACIDGLAEGVIEVIASDHAPHLTEEKEREFMYAPCGVLGLETTVGVLLTDLVHAGRLPLSRVIAALTSAPSDILQLHRGRLQEGLAGDVTVLDLEREWSVDSMAFRSKARNCPFNERLLRGAAVATVVGGKVCMQQ